MEKFLLQILICVFTAKRNTTALFLSVWTKPDYAYAHKAESSDFKGRL
jgi:hypothetical protein